MSTVAAPTPPPAQPLEATSEPHNLEATHVPLRFFSVYPHWLCWPWNLWKNKLQRGEKLTWFLGVLFLAGGAGRGGEGWVPCFLFLFHDGAGTDIKRRMKTLRWGPGAGARLLGDGRGCSAGSRVLGVLGRWGPTGLGPEEAALLGAAAVGERWCGPAASRSLSCSCRPGPETFLLSGARSCNRWGR